MLVQGLVPVVPADRPRASAVWWCARGTDEGGALRIERLEERSTPAPVETVCGLGAPCSLPSAFLAWLEVGADRRTQLRTIASWTPNRLFSAARRFAARRKHGDKHPSRDPNETLSALDRRRLARFHAALPLLTTVPTRPWDTPGSAGLFEVDTIAWLRALDLPATELTGSGAHAIARRASILRALNIEVAERDYAVASWPALEAVICCYAARNLPPAPSADAEAWVPVP